MLLKNLLAMIIAIGLVSCVSVPTVHAAEKTVKVATDKSKSSKTVTLTGCMDENENGDYVLRGDVMLNKIATLVPNFSKTLFARYLGNTVKVKGELGEADSDNPKLAVRSIANVQKLEDMCTPDKP